jgi:hypothetical protein
VATPLDLADEALRASVGLDLEEEVEFPAAVGIVDLPLDALHRKERDFVQERLQPVGGFLLEFQYGSGFQHAPKIAISVKNVTREADFSRR